MDSYLRRSYSVSGETLPGPLLPMSVKLALEEAMKAYKGCRSIALLIL
jgi:hypothetical protein